MNESVFFARVRALLFDGSLSAGQVAGIHAVLASCDRHNVTDLKYRAYILASVFHETGERMQPVRETFAKSDSEAVQRLEKAFKAGQLTWVKTPYWRPDADGKSWFGRGLIQITHRDNYLKLGKRLGVDLVANPDRALDLATSADIAVVGMAEGLFTGKELSDYFDDTSAKWVEARRIVNGTDRAALIAEYGVKFHAALIAARDAVEAVPPPPVSAPAEPVPASPEPDMAPATPPDDRLDRAVNGKVVFWALVLAFIGLIVFIAIKGT